MDSLLVLLSESSLAMQGLGFACNPSLSTVWPSITHYNLKNCRQLGKDRPTRIRLTGDRDVPGCGLWGIALNPKPL